MVLVFNLIVIVLVGFIAYMVSQEGLFSGFIHFVCTLLAGAVAFAVWEPLAYIMLGVREDIAWSVSLAIPFLVTLAVLRISMDKAIPYGMKFKPVVNLVGGGVFGVGSGVIAVGILVISMGFLRLPSGFLGYKPITYDSTGNLQHTAGLWAPVDKVTASLYEKLSVTGFSTGTPLATMAPAVNDQAALMRITFDDRGRTTLAPEDFNAIGRYTVSADSPNELFTDAQQPQMQQVRDLGGNTFPAGTTLEGFVIKFEAGAKEKGGQIVLGAGQVALLYQDESGATQRVLPIAVVTKAKSGTTNGRFRYDAEEVFLASVGAASTATMSFEFPLPPRTTPTYLLVKNIRVPVGAFNALPIPGAANGVVTTAQRDSAIDSDQILVGAAAVAGASGGGGSGSGAIEMNRGGTRVSGIDENDLSQSGVRVTTRLSEQFNRSRSGSLEVNDDNKIVSGKNVFSSSDISLDISPKLRVGEFYTDAGTTLVQVDVSWGARLSLLGKSYDAALKVMPIQLRAPGQTPYEVVGYIYKSDRSVEIRYDRGDPIRSYNQLPTLSSSKPNDKLTLLFLVDKRRDVLIETMQLGPEPIATFDPPMPTLR